MRPFDLEKALAGEPVKLRNGSKVIIIFNLATLPYENNFDYHLIGYFIRNGNKITNIISWTLEGKFNIEKESDEDIIGMWEEPRPTVTLTLPCPLKEPQEEMWFISIYNEVLKSSYKNNDINSAHPGWLEQGKYFATKEDAQAWIDAMGNSRK